MFQMMYTVAWDEDYSHISGLVKSVLIDIDRKPYWDHMGKSPQFILVETILYSDTWLQSITNREFLQWY